MQSTTSFDRFLAAFQLMPLAFSRCLHSSFSKFDRIRPPILANVSFSSTDSLYYVSVISNWYDPKESAPGRPQRQAWRPLTPLHLRCICLSRFFQHDDIIKPHHAVHSEKSSSDWRLSHILSCHALYDFAAFHLMPLAISRKG